METSTILFAAMWLMAVLAGAKVMSSVNESLHKITVIVSGLNETTLGLSKALDTILEAQIHFDERLTNIEARLTRAKL